MNYLTQEQAQEMVAAAIEPLKANLQELVQKAYQNFQQNESGRSIELSELSESNVIAKPEVLNDNLVLVLTALPVTPSDTNRYKLLVLPQPATTPTPEDQQPEISYSLVAWVENKDDITQSQIFLELIPQFQQELQRQLRAAGVVRSTIFHLSILTLKHDVVGPTPE